MFEKANKGPIFGLPILTQIEESLFWMQSNFPPDFEFRIYMTRELFQRIMDSVTIRINEQTPWLFGVPVYPTDGKGIWWWIGVPGFVIPEDEDADTTPR